MRIAGRRSGQSEAMLAPYSFGSNRMDFCEMASVIGHPIQTLGVIERRRTGQLESASDLTLHECGSALETAIGILLVDCLMMALWILATFEHGQHDRNELSVEVATVVGVRHCLEAGCVSNRSEDKALAGVIKDLPNIPYEASDGRDSGPPH